MARTYRLEIVTPERIVFAEDVEGLVAPAHEGYLGVLAGHAPLLCTLQPGEIKVQSVKGDKYFATSGGFLEVTPKKTILLSETAEPSDGIDMARAAKALERARVRLTQGGRELDRDRARAAHSRAENRLRIGKKRK